jgi:hypothetical protein
MFAAIEVLASLPRLVSIEVNKQFYFNETYDESDPYVDSSHDNLVKEVGLRLLKLQKIYCWSDGCCGRKYEWSDGCCGRQYEYWIWTREVDQWRGQEVDPFTGWDIMHNRY